MPTSCLEFLQLSIKQLESLEYEYIFTFNCNDSFADSQSYEISLNKADRSIVDDPSRRARIYLKYGGDDDMFKGRFEY